MLRERAQSRVRGANSSASIRGAGTAVGWYERYTAAFPSKTLFVEATMAGDLVASAHNEALLRDIAEFIRETGSVHPGPGFGKPQLAGTIRKIIGQIRMERTLGSGYNVGGVAGTNRPNKRQLKHMGAVDGPGDVRALELGFRARHFAAIVHTTFDRTSWWGTMRWAFCRLGYRCCGRGGELGTTDSHDFEPAYGLTWAAFRWIEPDDLTQHSILIVMYMAIKDGKLSKVRVPILCHRTLPRGDPGFDSCCVYDAVRAVWNMQVANVPAAHPGDCKEGCTCLRSTTPFFVRKSGKAISTRDVSDAVKAMAPFVGLDPDLLGGKSLRIAFATDAYEVLGMTGAVNEIQLMGRWLSEIWQIYARISAERHMHTFAEIEKARGLSLEELAKGWVQSAKPSLSRF